MSSEIQDVDVLIVGGGPAGLSAALCLGRGRKRVAVIDAGSPRHGVAEGVHNFLTREGMAPAELRRVAWEQMAAYPSVSLASGRRVERLSCEGERWVAEDGRGGRFRARAALLATGVIDEHPEIPGYRERWGHSIHQCPFCHGWEVRDQAIAVLATSAGSIAGVVHLGPLLKGWSDDVVVLTGGAALDEEQAGALREAGVEIYTQPVARLAGEGRELETIHFEDGSTLARGALFVATEQRQVPLVESLGLELSEMGSVVVDGQMRTARPMLWAAGDLTSRMQQVVESAAQGFRAGAHITATLTVE
jgi:thioredoxin reductase